MKATLTLIALLFATTFAAASIAVQAPEVTPIIISVEVSTEEVKEVMADKKEVARLYKFKNSRIKKALSFKTKKNKSKLA
ncbi:hypothetical protein [Aureicoccus marinus]|uniref:Uncharacterized protein n=1 Tax=Aureicoccus marinus TaxID=754435 RepID=A0A2S7T410_9FLAO|nr:hypothetical protein [Aureicoccus marinus]PQJ14659.1 hypothetical protein BST99_01895 [Aureicoccus marinus]